MHSLLHCIITSTFEYHIRTAAFRLLTADWRYIYTALQEFQKSTRL